MLASALPVCISEHLGLVQFLKFWGFSGTAAFSFLFYKYYLIMD